MFTESKDSNGNHVFVFVKVEPFDHLLNVLNFFETQFLPEKKQALSGWHTTVFEYEINGKTITIGDQYEALSVTLMKPLTSEAITEVRSWVQAIDDILPK